MKLPTPRELKKLLPLNEDTSFSIEIQRTKITQIIEGKSPLFAIIMGPCSLHHTLSALEYGRRLKDLQKKVEKTCLLIMRSHIEKPRTSFGWKGLLHDPHLTGKEDLSQGLFVSRQILLQLANLNIPLATEFLDPLASCYLSDLISWGFIGARTSASQIHRQLASSLPMPIGFKNSIEGNLESAIHGATFAQRSHSFLHINEEGFINILQSKGNPCSHIVLRGSNKSPNYHSFSIKEAVELSLLNNLTNRILVDCSHGNSQKDYLRQQDVFLSSLKQSLEENSKVMGAMLESHIEEGSQAINNPYLSPFLSVTDSCLDWDMTEKLVLAADKTLSSSSCFSFSSG